jgi:citrate lyase gamma subunit
MSNFRGYYIKIGNCTFTNPAIKREGLLIMPHLEQTANSGVLASGELSIKVLPHTRTKIQMQLPVMTPEQYQNYYSVIMSSMYLTVEYYNQGIDAYETGTFYHNDMQYKPIKWQGQEMIDMQEIHFIEH